MPTLPMAIWEIIYRPGEGPTDSETVRAAYACGEERLPGWTILKDGQHQIVKMVRGDAVAAISRRDA